MDPQEFANWQRSFKEAGQPILRIQREYDGTSYCDLELPGLPHKRRRLGQPDPYPWVHSFMPLGYTDTPLPHPPGDNRYAG